jgi:hypothetical protein
MDIEKLYIDTPIKIYLINNKSNNTILNGICIHDLKYYWFERAVREHEIKSSLPNIKLPSEYLLFEFKDDVHNFKKRILDYRKRRILGIFVDKNIV